MPYEVNKGDTYRAFKKALDMLDEACTKRKLKMSLGGQKIMLVFPRTDPESIKDRIVGEIYVVLEPAINFYIKEPSRNGGLY